MSTYMHKNRGGKLKMGPIWDLNIGYNRQDRVPFTDWIANYNQYVPRDAWMVPFWWKVFLGDDYFKQRLKERWTQYRSNQFSNQKVLNLVLFQQFPFLHIILIESEEPHKFHNQVLQ